MVLALELELLDGSEEDELEGSADDELEDSVDDELEVALDVIESMLEVGLEDELLESLELLELLKVIVDSMLDVVLEEGRGEIIGAASPRIRSIQSFKSWSSS